MEDNLICPECENPVAEIKRETCQWSRYHGGWKAICYCMSDTGTAVVSAYSKKQLLAKLKRGSEARPPTVSEIEDFLRNRLSIQLKIDAPCQDYGGGRTQKLTAELILTNEETPDDLWSGEVIASSDVELYMD